MKEYPSITSEHSYLPIIAFDKLDGSNIRAEWTKKKGFEKFGKRNGLLDDSNPSLLVAPELILNKYQDSLSAIFKKERYEKVTCFFELFGPNSFAGFHPDSKEQMQVILIDACIDKKGFMEGRTFLKIFEDKVEIPKICYDGKWNKELSLEVNEGRLEGMTFEGVVCKGSFISPGRPLMFKVKNHAWYKKLKEKVGDDENKFKELA